MRLEWWFARGQLGENRFQDKRATVADEIGIGSNSCGEADSGCQFVRGERFNE